MQNVPQKETQINDDYSGYSEWSASLELEPIDLAPAARLITAAEWSAIIGDEPDPEPPTPPALSARAERGLEIAVAGGVLALPGFFHVAGANGERYAVRLHSTGHHSCECGDAVWRIEQALEEGRTPVDRCCKHAFAVEHAIEFGLVVDPGRIAA